MKKLTDRQEQICWLSAQGYSVKVIAAALQLSVNTIETQKKRIVAKYPAQNFRQISYIYLIEKVSPKLVTLYAQNVTKNGDIFSTEISQNP